jgi:hypothetical protein
MAPALHKTSTRLSYTRISLKGEDSTLANSKQKTPLAFIHRITVFSERSLGFKE